MGDRVTRSVGTSRATRPQADEHLADDVTAGLHDAGARCAGVGRDRARRARETPAGLAQRHDFEGMPRRLEFTLRPTHPSG